MSIEIEVADGTHLEKWNEYVEKSQHGTIFHTIEWLKIAEKHSKSKLYPLIGTHGGEVIGLFPIFYVKKGILRMIFSPPPKMGIPYLGPAFINYDKLKQNKKEEMLEGFQESFEKFIGARLGYNYISVMTCPGISDMRFFKWAGYEIQPQYTYSIDLSGGAEFVWNNFKKSLRNDIKRAERTEICIEHGKRQDIPAVCEIIKKRFEEQKMKFNIKDGYFLDIYDEFAPRFFDILKFKMDSKMAGGMFFLSYGKNTYHWQGAVKREHRGLALADVLLWSSIKLAAQKRAERYELVGANTKRLSAFKSKYNPGLDMYFLAKKGDALGRLAEKAYLRLVKR